jgi:hypothetical protein
VTRLRWLLLAASMLAVAIPAPTVTATDGPEAAISGILDALASGKTRQLPDHLCSAQREDLVRRLDLTTVFADVPAANRALFDRTIGVVVDAPAMTVIDGDSDRSIVRLTGTIRVQVDEAALARAVERVPFGPTGTLDAALRRALLRQAIGDRLERVAAVTVLDSELELLREDGRWRLCSDLGWGIDPLSADGACGLLSVGELRLLVPIDFTLRLPEPDGCTFRADPSSDELSWVSLRIEQGDLAFVQATFPGGESLTIRGLDAYANEESLRIDLGGRLLAIQPTLIGTADGTDPRRLARAIADVVLPRIDR